MSLTTLAVRAATISAALCLASCQLHDNSTDVGTVEATASGGACPMTGNMDGLATPASMSKFSCEQLSAGDVRGVGKIAES